MIEHLQSRLDGLAISPSANESAKRCRADVDHGGILEPVAEQANDALVRVVLERMKGFVQPVAPRVDRTMVSGGGTSGSARSASVSRLNTIVEAPASPIPVARAVAYAFWRDA